MSRENVEIVRRLYALAAQGDEAVWDLVPPDFVFDFSRRLIDPAILRGQAQVRAFAEREGEAWEGGYTGWEPVELIDAGDKVLAFVRVSGRGKASGVDVEARTWNVWTFRDGALAELAYFGADRAQALKAMGLED